MATQVRAVKYKLDCQIQVKRLFGGQLGCFLILQLVIFFTLDLTGFGDDSWSRGFGSIPSHRWRSHGHVGDGLFSGDLGFGSHGVCNWGPLDSKETLCSALSPFSPACSTEIAQFDQCSWAENCGLLGL